MKIDSIVNLNLGNLILFNVTNLNLRSDLPPDR